MSPIRCYTVAAMEYEFTCRFIILLVTQVKLNTTKSLPISVHVHVFSETIYSLIKNIIMIYSYIV